MISIDGLAVEFSGETLFSDVNFVVNENDKIALMGKNGAGKSTMMKIIAGEQKPTRGNVRAPKDAVIAYLPQHLLTHDNCTVFEEASKAFKQIFEMRDEMEKLNKELETRTDYESDEYMAIITKVAELGEKYYALEEINYEAEVEKALRGLGFKRSDLHRQTSEFSGGWRMRIELAKLLLQKPDLILLDEPTNHVDIEAIQWLEEFMETFPGAVVLISHDKTFLDNVTTRTIEIVNQKIYDYKTNYSRYLVLRQERKEQQENAQKNQQKIIDQTEVLIDKYRAKANKASFAQSLIKKLDRMERVEVDEDDTAAMYFRFPPPAHSGKIVITSEHAGKMYGDKRIFSDANFIITKGERIGFVGRNGEGKSTMMKMIAKKVQHEGTVTLGHSVMMGYFEQD